MFWAYEERKLFNARMLVEVVEHDTFTIIVY